MWILEPENLSSPHWEREGPHSTNIIVPTKITTYPRSTRCHNISMAAYVCILCQQNTVSLKCLPLHRPRVLLRANPGTALSPSALHLVNLNKCEPIKYSLNATPHRNLFTAWLCRPAYLDKSDNHKYSVTLLKEFYDFTQTGKQMLKLYFIKWFILLFELIFILLRRSHKNYVHALFFYIYHSV